MKWLTAKKTAKLANCGDAAPGLHLSLARFAWLITTATA
jgi:hypothetical protein